MESSIRKEEIIEMAKDIQGYLERKGHPYITVEISMDGIKVKEDLLFIPTGTTNKHVGNSDSCQV